MRMACYMLWKKPASSIDHRYRPPTWSRVWVVQCKHIIKVDPTNADSLPSRWYTLFRRPAQDRASPHDPAARLQRTLAFAISKLTPEREKTSENAKLAWLAWRVMLNFDSTEDKAREVESRLVESYMRVVFIVPHHRRFMRTGTPSEPILAEAAARLLHHRQVNVPEVLKNAFGQNLIARGERAETVARAIFITAHDEAARSLCESGTPSAGPDLIYHRPIPLLLWLEHMFKPEVYKRILKFTPAGTEGGATLEEAFRSAWVHFSHFTLAADHKVVRREHLPHFMLRGTAVQACDDQAAIDCLGAIHFEKDDTATELTPITIDSCSWWDAQIQNRKTAVATSIPSHITDPLSQNKNPTLSFLLELGDESAPSNILDQVTESKSVGPARSTRGRASGQQDDAEKRHYQIDVNGLHSFRFWSPSDIENIQTALATTKYIEDFPRADEKENAELLQRLQSMWLADGESMRFATTTPEEAMELEI
jgi:hypothetical protein